MEATTDPWYLSHGAPIPWKLATNMEPNMDPMVSLPSHTLEAGNQHGNQHGTQHGPHGPSHTLEAGNQHGTQPIQKDIS